MARPEPPRINSYKTDIQSLEENICDAVDVDIAPNGTTTSTVFVDNTAVSTFTLTGTPQQSYTVALPNELYGRTIYAIHQGNAFKHYKTWFHLRPEPDRWTNFVSSRQTSDEQWFSNFNVDANCLGNIVLATAYVDNTATATYTMTGSGRRSYVHTLPRDTYGRIVHTVYNVQSGGKFKFFGEQYVGTPEPDRLSTVQSPVQPFPSNQHLKTWIAELNPLGTCTGTLYADNTVLTTSTFVGSYRQRFEVGLDVDTSLIPREAKTLRVVYSSPSGSVMKHYSTQFETEAQPFGKRTWMITYNKIGGATQLDMARFWSIEAEAQSGTALATCIWDVDGRALSTSTLTISTQAWQDRIPFPPDGRGYIFQLRVLANAPIRVYKSNLDTVQVGIKGLVRHTTPGTPQ